MTSLSKRELEIAIANFELALKVIPDPKLKILTVSRQRRWLLPHITYIRKNLTVLKLERQKRDVIINKIYLL
jgi:nucleoside-triphosphatase THEP1